MKKRVVTARANSRGSEQPNGDNDKSQIPARRSVLEDFLYYEAELLDNRAFDRWLSLWLQSDILYWVPCNKDDNDPLESLAIILDDRRHLEERVQRLNDQFAHSFQPVPRTHRVVSNVRIEEGEDSVKVNSAFTLGQVHKDVETIWFGRSMHKLIVPSSGSDIRIKEKVVYLLNNDMPMPSLLFLP